MTSSDDAPARGRAASPRLVWLGTGIGALAMIPWTIYVSTHLPFVYTTENWQPAWGGFDTLLTLCLAATAILGWLRRPSVVIVASAAGTLLLCDAWFDFMTSTHPGDHEYAVLSLLVELPAAAALLWAAHKTQHGGLQR